MKPVVQLWTLTKAGQRLLCKHTSSIDRCVTARLLSDRPPFTIEDSSVAVVFDQERRWVCVRVTDQFTAADAVDVIRSARADAKHQMWPMLVDARAAQNGLTEQDVDAMVVAVGQASRRQGTRGHVAIVAADDLLFSQLLRYETETARLGVRVIRVFR